MSKEKIIKELEKDKSSLKKENLYLTKQNANLKRKIDRLYDILSLRNGKCVKRTESIE
jgi:chaperonin cofactor prefoldin